MASVREASFEVLRAHGMTTIFGNPGSTELPMLADFPSDFSYVLGLQELVVVGMADGYAQATGRPTHVNLHTAPGVGNAVVGIFNAQANHAPLVITAGQQVRAQITIEANLTNRDAVLGPAPYVKWSHEPPRPQDVPGALARAIHMASLPPRGPAFVSIPMDDWNGEADEDRSRAAIARRVTGRAAPDEAALAARAQRLNAARAPVLVAGPEIDAAGGWEAAVTWPSASGSRCGPARRPAARGWASPRPIPSSSGSCRRRSARSARRSRITTSCWSSAPRCSPTRRGGPRLRHGGGGGDHARGAHRGPALRDRRRRRPPARPGPCGLGDVVVGPGAGGGT